MNPFLGYQNIIMLLEPKDIVTTATNSAYMDLKNANRACFLVSYGAITSDTALDEAQVYVQAATAVDGAEAQIAFNYRQSGALGTNTWGAITARTATQVVSLQAFVDDNKMLWIEIDPEALASSDYRYVRVSLTDSTALGAALVCVHGFIAPKYRMATFTSVTASASA